MCRSAWGSLQLDDCPSDPFPDGLAVEVASFEHEVGQPRRLNFGIGSVAPNEHVVGSPNVEVGDGCHGNSHPMGWSNHATW
jgi:hypothetical protein